jgi:hypothetical protein
MDGFFATAAMSTGRRNWYAIIFGLASRKEVQIFFGSAPMLKIWIARVRAQIAKRAR